MSRQHKVTENQSLDQILHAKYIARDENIPLIRIGFPIADRPGHNFLPITGYIGATNMVVKILDAFLDKQDRTCPEEKVEFQL